MFCPICRGTQIGIVGNHQYYCWNCCLEFHEEAGRCNVYEIAEDGSLTAVEKGSQIL